MDFKTTYTHTHTHKSDIENVLCTHQKTKQRYYKYSWNPNSILPEICQIQAHPVFLFISSLSPLLCCCCFYFWSKPIKPNPWPSQATKIPKSKRPKLFYLEHLKEITNCSTVGQNDSTTNCTAIKECMCVRARWLADCLERESNKQRTKPKSKAMQTSFRAFLCVCVSVSVFVCVWLCMCVWQRQTRKTALNWRTSKVGVAIFIDSTLVGRRAPKSRPRSGEELQQQLQQQHQVRGTLVG